MFKSVNLEDLGLSINGESLTNFFCGWHSIIIRSSRSCYDMLCFA